MTDPQGTQKMQEFIDELTEFNSVAEEALEAIRQDFKTHQLKFELFAEKMIAIRGTALQLNLPKIAHFCALSEEVALKAMKTDKSAHVRRAVGSLWDAVTTIQYLLQNKEQRPHPEELILLRRLEDTLRVFGGPRPTISQEEIQKLLEKTQ